MSDLADAEAHDRCWRKAVVGMCDLDFGFQSGFPDKYAQDRPLLAQSGRSCARLLQLAVDHQIEHG
jgi:hypothetical protein